MPFGNQVITFLFFEETGLADELGNYGLSVTSVDAPGCRFRPLTFAETAESQLDIATQPWRGTIPVGEYSQELRDTILAVQPDDVIRVDGVDYQIIGGIRHHVDMGGEPFKATIISHRQMG